MKGVDVMNIILFGPPGIGKSTIIGYLKTQGVRAIDLEDVYPSKIRFQLPNMLDGVVFGGADLDPLRHYPNCRKVILVRDSQEEYDAIRKVRDLEQPGKASQKHHRMEDWWKIAGSRENGAFTLGADGRSKHDDLEDILALVKASFKHAEMEKHGR
jgi:hypothetical protein